MPPRGPYLGRFKSLCDDGPPELVAIIAHEDGRWASSFTARQNTPALNYLNQMREQTHLGHVLPQPALAQRPPWQLLGFVIMSLWRLMEPMCTDLSAGGGLGPTPSASAPPGNGPQADERCRGNMLC